MDSWSPLFSKIVDSSLWFEPDFVVKVFLTMIAKKDSDHVVRGNAFIIGSWSKKTEAETLEALNILAAPDTRRIEPQPYGGRRIEKVEDGWKILNGQMYEDLMRKLNRRVYKARKEREAREKKRGLKMKSPTSASERQFENQIRQPDEKPEDERTNGDADPFSD